MAINTESIAESIQRMGKEVGTAFIEVCNLIQMRLKAYADLEEAVARFCMVTGERPQEVSSDALRQTYRLQRNTGLSMPTAFKLVTIQLQERTKAALMGIPAADTANLDMHQLNSLIMFHQAGMVDMVAEQYEARKKVHQSHDHKQVKAWRDNLGKGRGKRRV